MAEKGNKMADEKAVFELKITDLKPQQPVLNLDTNEDVKITVESKRYELPKYDSKIHGTKEQFVAAAMKAAQVLVHPVEKQIDALLYRATQESYQAGKAAALATGNYLTQDLRTNIAVIMQANVAYADLKASDCVVKWREGHKAGKAGAAKILAMAQAMGAEDINLE